MIDETADDEDDKQAYVKYDESDLQEAGAEWIANLIPEMRWCIDLLAIWDFQRKMQLTVEHVRKM